MQELSDIGRNNKKKEGCIVNWAKDELERMQENDKGEGICECSVCGRRFDPVRDDEYPCICPECWKKRLEKKD